MRPLSPDSPRRLAASRFGAELRHAMNVRSVGARRLATAVGSATSAIAVWKAGDNLPRTDTAQRLADALDWPKLVVLAREGRNGVCARCRRPFVNEGGGPKRFCSADCREVDVQLREASAKRTLAATVQAEVDRVHGTTGAVSRKTLAVALAEYRRSESKRNARSRTIETRLGVVQAAVDAMCDGCEPAGICRDAMCALRPVSPFPVALRPRKSADEIEPAEGPWGPTHRPAQLVAIRAANAERWSRPGERDKAHRVMVARYAAETPEQKAERIRRVSAGRRRGLLA